MRRSADVVIQADNRDRGGVFVITEMPALQATEWFIRAMQILARSGADVPPNILNLGAAGFVSMGVGTVLTGLGKAPWHEVKPLLDELLTCIQSYQPPGAVAPITRWELIKTQIQEPSTILLLHEEVVSLHLGFSLRARLLSFRTLAATLITEFTPNTPTSDASPE